jgi:hypothetical protein
VRRRGATLIELMIAGGLVLLLLLASEATMRHIGQISSRSRHQVEARQQVRAFVATLRADLLAASHLFLGYSGNLLGASINVPLAGDSGDSLLYAIPENDSLNPRYVVGLVYARPRSRPDPNNPDVREMVYHRFSPVASSPPATPGALDPHALLPGGTKLFDTFIPPGPVTGADPFFSLRVAPNGEGVAVLVRFRVQPPRGDVLSERYQTYVTLRNNV